MFRLIVALALILSIYHAPSVHGAPHPPTTAAPLVANQGSYDTKFDNIDLDEVLSQERLLRNYIKCLENLGPCTPDSKMLKGMYHIMSNEFFAHFHTCSIYIYELYFKVSPISEILPDAVSTDCAKCSEKQKLGSAKVTHFLIDNRPEDWARLEQIYDPSGNYRLAYLAEKDKGNSQSDTGEQTPSEAVTKTNEAWPFGLWQVQVAGMECYRTYLLDIAFVYLIILNTILILSSVYYFICAFRKLQKKKI